MPKLRHVGIGWAKQLWNELSAPNGWQIAAKSIAYLTGFMGLVITFVALMLNLQMEQIKKNDELYQQFLTDLSSSQERVRVAAITRIPELLTRKGQRHSSVTTLSIIWRSLGFGETQVHAEAVRNQVKQLLLYGPTEGSTLSERESQAIVDALRRTSPSVWFESDQLPRESSTELSWLWAPENSQVNAGLAAFTRALFNEAKLKGVSFTGLNLSRAEFIGFSCTACRFERTNLSNAILFNAKFEGSFFDYTNLDDAKLTGAQLTNVSFYGSSLRGIGLQKSVVFNSKFHLPDIGPSPTGTSSDFRGTTFKSTSFTECLAATGANFVRTEFEDSRMYRCKLDEANFKGANFIKTVFDGSSLAKTDLSDVSAQSASFVNTDLTGATLNRTNLLEADLSGVRGLHNVGGDPSTSGPFLNLNIARVKGLDSQARTSLILSGAVEIKCDWAWKQYKQAGYPHETWPTYQACPNQ